MSHDLKPIREALWAARGLSYGTDWNNGNHAKIYRQQLLDAISPALACLVAIENAATDRVVEQHEITKPPAASSQDLLAMVETLWKNVERALRLLTVGYHFDYSATKHSLIEAHALCRPLWDRVSSPVDIEKGSAAHYNAYFGGNDKWPDATDNERAVYMDGTKATAKAWGLKWRS